MGLADNILRIGLALVLMAGAAVMIHRGVFRIEARGPAYITFLLGFAAWLGGCWLMFLVPDGP